MTDYILKIEGGGTPFRRGDVVILYVEHAMTREQDAEVRAFLDTQTAASGVGFVILPAGVRVSDARRGAAAARETKGPAKLACGCLDVCTNQRDHDQKFIRTLDRGAMQAQSSEFDAVVELTRQWKRLQMTAVVDDDYFEVRHGYESALYAFIEALCDNGRFKEGTRGSLMLRKLGVLS